MSAIVQEMLIQTYGGDLTMSWQSFLSTNWELRPRDVADVHWSLQARTSSSVTKASTTTRNGSVDDKEAYRLEGRGSPSSFISTYALNGGERVRVLASLETVFAEHSDADAN